MEEVIRRKLIEIAKLKKVISYGDLIIQCGLLINLGNIGDRNQLSRILGEISKNELGYMPQRPPLSVLVVLKNSHPPDPSYGFYDYMDELKIRKSKETNEEMRNRLMNWCHDYWSKH